MNPTEQFKQECESEIKAQGDNLPLQQLTRSWMDTANSGKYSYHFEWLGRQIIQYPQDILAMQQIIWEVKPDLIIETGIAHGGSLIFSASMLELIATCTGSEGEVLGIDIDIRPHNRKAIEEHPLFKRISMIQGSSIAPETIAQVKEKVKNKKRILVCLDSNHTHDHVLAELEAYAPLTTLGSYCVVMDTVIEDMPEGFFPDRPWGKGNNPKTSVWKYLKSHSEFEIDKTIQNKIMITVAPDGYLKRVR
jgi:cephalosporin hydroxylase